MKFYSRIATHVVITTAELRQTVRGEGAKTQLPRGTSVTLVRTESKFAYVPRTARLSAISFLVNWQS